MKPLLRFLTPSYWEPKSLLLKFLVSLSITGLAFSARLLLLPVLGAGAPFVMFYFSIILISLTLGLGQAVMAVLLSTLLSLYFLAHAGTPVSQLVLLSLIFAIEGLILSYLSCSVVKAKRQAESNRDDALAATALRDEFLAIVSHDLRNPLTSIRLKAELIAQAEGDKTRKQALSIKTSAEIMNQLIESLLDAQRVQAGRLRIEPEAFEIEAVADQVLELMGPIAESKSVVLKKEMTEPGLLAYGEPQRILQVLSNLVGNALKFSSPGKSVVLRGQRSGEEIRYEVQDEGPGITEAELPSLFERHWQGKEASARSGLGLGLFIAKKLVEAHQGRIWVESRVGVGTTIFFTLPERQPKERPTPLHTI